TPRTGPASAWPGRCCSTRPSSCASASAVTSRRRRCATCLRSGRRGPCWRCWSPTGAWIPGPGACSWSCTTCLLRADPSTALPRSRRRLGRAGHGEGQPGTEPVQLGLYLAHPAVVLGLYDRDDGVDPDRPEVVIVDLGLVPEVDDAEHFSRLRLAAV